MKKRDYELVKNGKYNRRAIMQRAYVYMRNYNYSLSSALKTAWCDAHFRQAMIDLNPTLRSYDSSWR